MGTRLFLVRHGQTESNRMGLALGRADPPLNELGLAQADRTAGALSGEGITVVYASPLTRTQQTADQIAAACGLEVTVDDLLIEMDVGELDGLGFPEVRKRYPDFIDKWLSEDGPNERMPGGESLADVRDRGVQFLERVRRERADQAVCAVTHNFVILALLATVLGGELAAFRRLKHEVAAISVLEDERGHWRITKMNDTCHVDGLSGN